MQRLPFPHPIYKISPDPYEPYLGIEFRDSEQRKAYVQLVTCDEKGQCIPDQVNPAVEVPWWINFLGCFHGILLYHSFDNPEVPRPTALHAIDGCTGHPLWTVSEAIWQETIDQKISVQVIQEKNIFLDLRTGMQTTISSPTNPITEIGIPRHYPEGNQYLNALQKLIRYITENQPIGACDYLELPSLIIISYYFYEADKLKNNLLIVTKTGQVQWHESLFLGEAQGHTTFVSWRHQVIYIKDQVYLCCYAVS